MEEEKKEDLRKTFFIAEPETSSSWGAVDLVSEVRPLSSFKGLCGSRSRTRRQRQVGSSDFG